MPSQIKIINSPNFHHFFTVKLFTVKLVLVPCVLKLNKFRTSSPPTSCYRLGLCMSTATRSWRSWSLPALKIGRRSRLRERKRSSNLSYLSTPTNKDKIYLRKDLNTATRLLSTTGCVQRYKTRSWWSTNDVLTSGRSRSSGGWRSVARRNKTCNPWLVRTEVSRLI
jgi:hypothetical protein